MKNRDAVIRSDGTYFANMKEAARQSGCRPTSIWKVCTGQRKSAGHYGWEYADKGEDCDD